MSQVTIRGGRRKSTAFCYLDPARSRPNLTIQANALTECLMLEGKRCVGVRYTVSGQQARSPRRPRGHRLRRLDQLAEAARAVRHRPGGRAAALGIEVRHELRGVGENLRDHYSPRVKLAVPHAHG